MSKRVIKSDPSMDDVEDLMQFRLTYQGLLLAEATRGGVLPARAEHKQEIRKVFHRQLKRLWEIHPYLMRQPDPPGPMQWRLDQAKVPLMRHNNSVEGLANRFSMNGYRFVPLMTKDLEVLCSVDVLFLRNDPPGSVVRSGDIDNRLKTLFDALTMPRDRNQLGSYTKPDDGEDPFFCLLEDDSLITKASVETDTLLQPTDSAVDVNDARVTVTVKTNVFNVRKENIAFV